MKMVDNAAMDEAQQKLRDF